MLTKKRIDEQDVKRDNIIYDENISFILDMTNWSISDELYNKVFFAKSPEEFRYKLNNFYASKIAIIVQIYGCVAVL